MFWFVIAHNDCDVVTDGQGVILSGQLITSKYIITDAAIGPYARVRSGAWIAVMLCQSQIKSIKNRV